MTKPMLAMDYKKRGHNIVYPCFIQPKLDGVRALATRKGNTITYTSRDEKEFPAVYHLTKDLLRLMNDGEVWDGELYSRTLTFQEIVSAVKRNKTTNPDTIKIEYHVYDCVMKGAFETRYLRIDSAIKNGNYIIPVPTRFVECEDDMLACHKTMLANGYEGTIVRNKDGEYANKRSVDLQKYKDMEDAEFVITDTGEGEGKDKGCIVFTCRTEDGNEFEARPNGKYARRARWFKERKHLIGKMLTVQYQGFTDGGKPRFPIALEIRDYE